MPERTLTIWTGVIYAAAVLALGVPVVTAPLPILIDRFIPDDAFYYFNTAKHFATTGFSSFDGMHFTNGYHPLWFLMSAAVFCVFPEGGETPFRVLLLVQLALAAAGAALMAHTIAARYGAAVALVSGLLWLVVCQRTLVAGLEIALQTLLFAACLVTFLRYVDRRGVGTTRAAVQLGVAAGCLFLARTDGIFLIGALALYVAAQQRRTDFVAFAAPVVLLAGCYLATNLSLTGHAMPVSGAAKMYYSEIARTAAAAAGASTWQLWTGNLLWPLATGATWIVIALVLAAAAICWSAASLWRRRGRNGYIPNTTGDEQTWPFAAAALASFVFYATAFYGVFTQTNWYYGPLMMTGWLYLAAASALVQRSLTRPDFRRPFGHVATFLGGVPWIIPALVAGAAVGWISLWSAAAALAAALIGWQAAARFRGRAPALAAVAILILVAMTVIRVSGARGLNLDSWVQLMVIASGAGALAAAARSPGLTMCAAALGIAVPTWLVQGTNLLAERRSPAVGWGAHLLAGAEWARRALPEDATISSASSGILGYFSERRVVNTDGLANSYEFLETVLRARRVGQYIRQWDYAIDAFPDRDLERLVREGCFVPLPNGVAPPPFDDGGKQRQLAVFQMKASGVVQCPPD